MKKYAIIIGAFILAVAVAFWAIGIREATAPAGGQACTEEAKICPDGSAVWRTGPNCEFSACPVAVATTTSGLAIGAMANINGTTIGVLSLVEDSRCPVDVQCIQAGTVRVRVALNAYSRDFTFTLGQPQIVDGATITLASVSPTEKHSKQMVSPSDYRFVFTVVPKVATSENSGVRGFVLLGPTCPVMRIPPDPACADKPYATAVTVYRSNAATPFKVGNSDANGAFTFSLPAGSYTLKAAGGTMLPRCASATVVVTANNFATTTISCDTGIR